MLCRCDAYAGPGLPSPTTSQGSTIGGLCALSRRGRRLGASLGLLATRLLDHRRLDACLSLGFCQFGGCGFSTLGGGDVDDQGLRVECERRAIRQREVAGQNLSPRLEVLDRNDDRLWDVRRFGLNGHSRVLHDHQRFADRLTFHVHGNVNGYLLTPSDDHQVDVFDRVLDRVALDLLGQRELRLAIDVDRQQRVRCTEREQRFVARQRDVDRSRAVTVEDGGYLVGAADPAGSALAELGTRFGDELDLGHERTPRTSALSTSRGAQRGSRSASSSITVLRPSPRQPNYLSGRQVMPPTSSRLALTREKASHGAILEDLVDRTGDQRSDGE